MSGTSPVRVLVSDSHPLFAQGVAAVLRGGDRFWVEVAPVPPGELSGLDSYPLAVLGVDADVRGVWAACDHLLSVSRGQQVRFVLLLPGRSEFEMTAAASLGAAAVLPRSASPESLREAAHAVSEGRTLVASGLAERMLSDFATMLRRSREATEFDLSRRELEVLALVAQGRSNREVAAALHISDNTVKNHVRRLLEKLGAQSRTEAVAIAARNGIIAVGQGVWSPTAERA